MFSFWKPYKEIFVPFSSIYGIKYYREIYTQDSFETVRYFFNDSTNSLNLRSCRHNPPKSVLTFLRSFSISGQVGLSSKVL